MPGVVPEDQRGYLPRLEFCDKASDRSVQAAEQLRWAAFRQLNLTTPDEPRSHQVFAQEFLLAGEPSEVASTYAALRAGIAACSGATTEYEEGVVGHSQELEVPALGDASIGTHEIVKEPSPRGPATWDIRNVVVRDGAVLMSVQLGEVTVGKEIEPVMDRATVDSIVTTIAQKLP